MESPVEFHDQEELVFKKNALVHSRQTFSLLQQKIIIMAAAQIQKNHHGDEVYDVRIQDLINLGTSKDIYNRLEKETRTMVSKVATEKKIESDGKRRFIHRNVVAKADHKEGSGIVKIQFSPDVQKMLFQLKGEWSAAVAVELASCQTSYGPLLYDKFMSHRRFGKWEVSVKDLRFELGLEDKYKNFTDFRRRVLKKAQKDLQKNTNMRFTWEEQKNARGRGKGRKITHIKFDFSWKPNQMDLPIEEPKKKGDFDIYGLRQRLKVNAQLNRTQIEKVLQYLEHNPGKRELFKDKYSSISACLQRGVDFNDKALNDPQGWAWPKIKKLIEN